MMVPQTGDRYPASGVHRTHVARISAIDLHGQLSCDEMMIAPTLVIDCSCGQIWEVELDEVVTAHAC